MEDKNKTIAAKIKELRLTQNMAQNDIAKKLHITVTAYNRIENSKTQLTVNMLFAIAAALDVSVGDLLELTTGNIVNNKDNVVMANFNHGHLHVSISPEELKKHIV